MSTFTVTPQVVEALSQLKEPTELLDDRGNLLGMFTPAKAQGRVEDLFDLEEAERISRTEGHLGKPLAEILRDLQAQGATE